MPWEVVKEGGPWAILLFLSIAFLMARSRGIIATEKEVDRAIAGYVSTNSFLERERDYWRAACEKKDATITALTDQNAKLSKTADTATYALAAILKEGKARELGS